jgi:thymidylate synthase ThyX
MSSTTAKVVADTICTASRITTFEIYAPRYILAEINTHRVIAKSAQSSRAIPVKKRIAMVQADPYIPDVFGRNRPGMQSNETLSNGDTIAAEYRWKAAMNHAVQQAQALEQLGVHKQQANRLLEPFAYFYGVLTATEWDNFWDLRCHLDADPAFYDLAGKMHDAYVLSVPREDVFHLPYCDNLSGWHSVETRLNISAARCARVSYKTFDGKVSTSEDDEELCKKLKGSPPHLSPFDHPAMADTTYTVPTGETYWSNPGDQRQFWGWTPYRVEIERELGITCRRDSYAQINANQIDLTWLTDQDKVRAPA